MNNLENIIGTAEAAEILGLSPDHVKKLCRDGKIKAKLIGKTWIMDKTNLEVKKMKKIENFKGLLSYLESELNFRSYGLDEGFDDFENKILASHGSSTSEETAWETFEWFDNDKNDVKIEIAFIKNPLDEEWNETDDFYLIR